ncbi:MAG: TonB-dependent receptor [Tannerella sp.]|jgi:TonB-linked SusC/RagA family outer membrane protein|nr:TonB-dependent receptor [Tannerella sp.]
MKKILYFLFFVIPVLGYSQTFQISGTVTDASDGSPLPGASVRNQRNAGTATDVDGKYVFQVQKGDVLTFSFLGMLTQTVKIENQTTVNVILIPDDVSLEEVVVIAYGQQKKVTVTGAVSSIGNENLVRSPAASLGNAIAGKLPGVQTVQYSGLPGADDPIIRIRGISTFNGADPLVLVDGVERSFSQIDANEVADITILKDASATAVFGVRGANGVILVTTKRGDVGKPSVTVTAQAGIQQITRFIETVDSYTYATSFNNAQAGDGVAKANLKFSDAAIQHFKDRDLLMLYPDTDWLDYMLDNQAWQKQYNINVNGGNETARYFVSVGMLDQDGLFKDFGFDPEARFKYRRYNYRANLDINLSKISQLSVNIGGRLEARNYIGDDEQELFSYLQKAVPFSGIGLDSEGRRIIADQALVGEYENSELGRVYRLGYVKDSKNVLNLDLQYQLKLDMITKGLDFKIKGSYNSEYTQQKNRKNGYGTGITYKATVDPSGALDENGNPKVVLVRQGDEWPIPYSESRWGGRNWYAEAGLNYARKFDNHDVGALVLYNQSKTYYPYDNLSLYSSIPTGYIGLVGRVTYNYATKYLADINIGYNGSENFAPGRRYGFFPSASIGWIPSSEKFWEPLHDFIPYLKLRGSLGRVGNDKTGANRFLYLPGVYQWLSGGPDNHGVAGTANFGTNNNNWLPGVRETSTGNPYVTWETATKQNYGLDMKLFNEKFSVNIDYFIEDRTDILVSNAAVLPSILGIQSNSVNYGHVRNKGYEAILKWEDTVGDVYYSISPTLSFARSKIIDQMEVPPEYPHLSSTGYPVWQPFGYEFFEFYVAGETEKHYQDKYGVPMPDQGTVIKNGDCIYVDLTDDGKIDPNDRHAIGYTEIPEYTASVNLSLSYKGFDFYMFWIGATNVNRYLGQYYRPQWGATNNSALLQWVYDYSWREDNASTALLPRLTFANMAHNTLDSRVWQIDASYIRLKNMELGYTFRKFPWIPQIGNLRLYATGYNLLTFSRFKANDPESRGGGWPNSLSYPMTRVINFGIKVNF